MKIQKEIEPCICGSLDHQNHPSDNPQPTPGPLDRTIETLERIEGFFKNNTPVNAGALFDDHTTMADAVRQALFYARKSVNRDR